VQASGVEQYAEFIMRGSGEAAYRPAAVYEVYDAAAGGTELDAALSEPGEQNQLIFSVRRSERVGF
jgi:hypothetical protein